MELDMETQDEIRAILARQCVVEVTVTFYDEADGSEQLEPVDIGTTLEFDAETPPATQEKEFHELLGSLGGILTGVVRSRKSA